MADLVETAKAQIRSKVEYPFRVIKAAVRLSEDPTAWPNQEPLQDPCADSLDESFLGAPLVALGDMSVVVV